MEAWRSSSEGKTAGNRGGDADDDGRAVGTPSRYRKGVISVPATLSVDGSAGLGVDGGAEEEGGGGAEAQAEATLGSFSAWEKNVAGARQPAGEQWCLSDEGQAAEGEEYLPIEDRLEAVMKDLGVPLRDDEVQPAGRRSLTPPSAREAHGEGVADGGGDGQLGFEALGSAAVVMGTRDGSTEAGGGGGGEGGVAIGSNGGRDCGLAAGVRSVR